MIYIIDEPTSLLSHSTFLIKIIQQHTQEHIELCVFPTNPTISDIAQLLYGVIGRVQSTDVVLCAWSIDGDTRIDTLFENLAARCSVVAAAGNSSTDISNTTPARVQGVITIGCLNKSGKQATLSNFSRIKAMKWVPGTNYNVDGILHSGTSVSAALYAAFLAESIIQNNSLIVNELISDHITRVLSDLK